MPRFPGTWKPFPISLALDCDWQGPYSGVPAQLAPSPAPVLLPRLFLLPTNPPTNRKNNPILKAHHPFPCTSVRVSVPHWCCLGSSIGFVFESIHGLHSCVPVMTEHLLLLHVPVWECCCDTCYTAHGWKINTTKQSVAVYSRVEHIPFSHSATLIGHWRHQWVFLSPELSPLCCNWVVWAIKGGNGLDLQPSCLRSTVTAPWEVKDVERTAGQP